MPPISLKEKAINYRRKGYSYNMISRKLGISKSTLSGWLKEIPYTANKEVLRRVQFAPARSGEIAHNKKVESIKKIKSLAKQELGSFNKRDLWLLGIGLYLGEGTKLHENIRLINSDIQIIKIAIKWFKEICGLKTENFTLAIHAYPDNDMSEIVEYWSTATGIPKGQFGKIQIDTRTNKSQKRKGKLPYGTAHLTIKSRGNKNFGVALHRRIMGWIESLMEQI